MLKMLNKKAQIAEGWLWIIRLLFLIMPLALAIAFFVSVFVPNINVVSTEAFILAERADSCFFSNGILDIEEFENADKCYFFGDEDLQGAIKLTLTFSDQIKEISTGKVDFFEICGLGGNAPYCKEFRKYVLVKSDKFYPGSLDIKIALKK